MCNESHENYVMSQKLIPPELFMYVMFLTGRALHLNELQWVRNRASENRPGDIRPNHFVYTCVGTRVSTRVGAFVWNFDTEKANFCGHSRVHLREHSREHLREPFRGSIFRFRQLCASLIQTCTFLASEIIIGNFPLALD